jgi:NAD(P)-dependent dehydrogenase (short-subunit alcohol dehydrogenase family)
VTWDIRGKRVLITGGNTGIGRASAAELLRRGARVTITAREARKGERAVEELSSLPGVEAGQLEWRFLDLARASSVRAFAQEFEAAHERLDVLLHNAGLVLSERRTTEDGLEMTFGVNHLGPFLLTRELQGMLRRSAPARIVVVASEAHRMARRGLDFDDLQSEQRYGGVAVYGASKLANILFARELAGRMEGSGVTVNCLHPGVVATDFTRDGDAGGSWGFFFKWFRPFLKSPEKGARTSVHLVTAAELSEVSGAYFKDSKRARPSGAARSAEQAERLWAVSEELAARLLP